MTTRDLDQLTPTLMAIPTPASRTPGGMPIAAYLAEAETLGTLVQKPEVRGALERVGVDPGNLDIYPTAVRAARQAQSLWTQVRGRWSSESFTKVVEQAEVSRRKLLKACDWNLRHDVAARQALTLIREGRGTADLAQDLHELAELAETNQSAFARDQTFDVPTVAAQAHQLAELLVGEQASEYHRFSKSEAKNLRDRAFTYLTELTAELREAGAYAYDDDSEMNTRFVSRYWGKQNRRTGSPAEVAESFDIAEIDPADVTDPAEANPAGTQTLPEPQ